MRIVQESATGRERKNLPLQRLLESLGEVLQAINETQRRSESALEHLSVGLRSLHSEEVGEQPSPTEQEPENPRSSASTAPTPEGISNRALRAGLLELHNLFAQIDRLRRAEQVEQKLVGLATGWGLRTMLLHERSRTLHAELVEERPDADEKRFSANRKRVVEYTTDGVFALTAQERFIYSGPRPSRAIPPDLVSLMGRPDPAWCLVVPLPHQNRWARFIYVDATAEDLEKILKLDLVARYATLQLREARFQPHRSANRIRRFLAATLRERGPRSGHHPAVSPAASASPQAVADPPARGPSAGGEVESTPSQPPPLRPPEAERFDPGGRLVRPIDAPAIRARIGEVPSLPPLARRLIEMLSDPETPIVELQEVVESEPEVATRLVQIANSSLYGGTRDVGTIGEAILRMGFSAIRSWMLSIVTRQLFCTAEMHSVRGRLWRQSVLCAVAAQLIAERTRVVDPDAAFAGGLLQNLGLLLLARNHPKLFDELEEQCVEHQCTYYIMERQRLGFDHADSSALVLAHWGIGAELIDAIAAHHRLERSGEGDTLPATIAVAEEMTLRLGAGPTEECNEDLAELAAVRQLGLDSGAIDQISEKLGQVFQDRNLLGF